MNYGICSRTGLIQSEESCKECRTILNCYWRQVKLTYEQALEYNKNLLVAKKEKLKVFNEMQR